MDYDNEDFIHEHYLTPLQVHFLLHEAERKPSELATIFSHFEVRNDII